MQGKWTAVAAVSLAFGLLGFAALVKHPEAQAHGRAKAQLWEHKVIFSSVEFTTVTREDKSIAKLMTDDYNALAADAWEYVGSIGERKPAGIAGGGSGVFTDISGIFVLFKRPKQ
jgi:hypothetical protein